jgi:hypothetical protein
MKKDRTNVNHNSTKKKPYYAAPYKDSTLESVKLSVRYARAKRKLKKLGQGYYLVQPGQIESFGLGGVK